MDPHIIIEKAEPPIEDAARLLNLSNPGKIDLSVIENGGNNRVFKLAVLGRTYLLKKYFCHKDDPRDRLKHEWSYLTFVRRLGVTCVPTPIAMDDEKKIGIYSYIEGSRPLPDQFRHEFLTQAIAFHMNVNHKMMIPEGKGLPEASEACFSMAQHLAQASRRVDRLVEVEGKNEIDRACVDFVKKNLQPALFQVEDRVLKICEELDLPLEKELDRVDRCLSPSDFGFHNSILSQNGQLTFVDFEYAGWDDPAKLIADFFNHPAFPVPSWLEKTFRREVLSLYRDPAWHQRRCDALRPIHQIKWCCIMLNPFLPMDRARHRFARPSADIESLKTERLYQATNLLESCLQQISNEE